VPATRRLARSLGVSRQVVVTAYEELASTGHLKGRIGDGSYVAVAGVSRWNAEHRVVDPDGCTIVVCRLR
jgi:DNA-binding GntR family transcriptional regulator